MTRRPGATLVVATVAATLGACFGDSFGDFTRAGGEGPSGRGHETAGASGAGGGGGTSAGAGAGGAAAGAGAAGTAAGAGATAGAGAATGAGAAAGASGGGAGGGGLFCAGKSAWPCDPVSDAPCGAIGSACDIDVGKAAFACFPPPNALSLGAPCKLAGPDFCQQGATCLNGACARFCCDDGPCAGLGTCQQGNLPGVIVGLCACDPNVTSTLSPTLTTLSQQYAPGAATEGTALCGALTEGRSLARAVTLAPGRCYTAIGVADASGVALELTLQTLPSPGLPKITLATSGAASPAPVLGAEPTCYKPTGAKAIDAVFTVSAKKGGANVLAQLYSK